MTRLPLSIAFALVAVLPALGEDVPFAAPPPQSSTYLASLGRHHGENPIAAYQALVYRNIPVEYIVSVDKPLIALQFAVKSKDGAQLNEASPISRPPATIVIRQRKLGLSLFKPQHLPRLAIKTSCLPKNSARALTELLI